MKMEPLSPALGAEITGVDLATLKDGGWEDVHAALAEHLIVVVRDQELGPDALLDVARRFGEPELAEEDVALPDHPYVREVRKKPEDEVNFGGIWHTDGSARRSPPRYTFLYGVVTPEGGDTLFANQIRAWDAIEPELRDKAEALVGYFRAPGDRDGRLTPHRIKQHNVCGRPYLYVSSTHLRHFEGETEEESAALRDRLAAAAIRPEHRARLVWRPGTLAIWNNRATQHLAVNDYAGKLRVMHRLLVP